MYRSSPFRSTLNTGYITGLGMCKVCTEPLKTQKKCRKTYGQISTRLLKLGWIPFMKEPSRKIFISWQSYREICYLLPNQSIWVTIHDLHDSIQKVLVPDWSQHHCKLPTWRNIWRTSEVEHETCPVVPCWWWRDFLVPIWLQNLIHFTCPHLYTQ